MAMRMREERQRFLPMTEDQGFPLCHLVNFLWQFVPEHPSALPVPVSAMALIKSALNP
jgi:hypothetical protein